VQQLKLNLGHFDFYCPVTGQAISRNREFTPSNATLFAYLDDIGDFVTTTPEIAELVGNLDPEDELYGDEIVPMLLEFLDRPNVVCFVITNNGFACGPVSSTIRIGIDMNYPASN
jgi:hypothetical protein